MNNNRHYKKRKLPPSFKEDNKRGMKAEKNFILLMKQKYSLDIKKMSPYHFSDFISKNKKILFELKRRNNKRKDFPYTIIGYDKVTRFKHYNQKQNNLYLFIMVFHFNDGIFFFVHNDNYKYKIKKYVRHKRIDFVDKKKDYIFIPVEELRPLEDIREYISHKIIIRHNI